MPEGYPKKLTDDQVRRILLTPKEVTTAALAADMGLAASTVYGHRYRRTRWSLRIARELGLLAPPSPHMHDPDADEGRAYVVAGKR